MGVAPVFLIVNFVLLVVLVAQFVSAQGDFTKVPRGLPTAYNHAMFVGVMTNLLFGVAIALSRGRRTWPWADHLIFWPLNLGLAGFLAVLLFAGYESDLVRYTAPVMGLGILLGIVTVSMRLNATAEPAPAAAAMRA